MIKRTLFRPTLSRRCFNVFLCLQTVFIFVITPTPGMIGGLVEAAEAAPVVIFAGRDPEPVRINRIHGRTCLSLNDVARWVNGHLHWYPVSAQVKLSVRTHEVQFFPGKTRAIIDGRQQILETPTVREKDDVWVPVSFFRSPSFQDISKVNFEWQPQKRTLRVKPLPGVSAPLITSLPDQTLIIVNINAAANVHYGRKSATSWDAQIRPVNRVDEGRWSVDDGGVSYVQMSMSGDAAFVHVELEEGAQEPRAEIEKKPRAALVLRVPRSVIRVAPQAIKKAPVVSEAAAVVPKETIGPAPVVKQIEKETEGSGTVPGPKVVPPPPVGASAYTGLIKRIVIDPGHGGKDPGTSGAKGTEEKAINLLLAEDLAESLREKYGYEVLLTRTDDRFIPLKERSEIANHYNADLFISVHCNASLSSSLKGFEVYFLSESASDTHADAVARLENSSLRLEEAVSPRARKVEAMLRSMVKNVNINESSTLGSLIDRQAGDHLDQPRLGVKQAGFYVLRGAEMPAVLVEVGFLTNKKEERLLLDESYRRRLVKTIEGGIVSYAKLRTK